MNISKVPPMVARLRADPFVQEMISRNTFEVMGFADMVLDMNRMSDDYRRIVVERWCQAHATGRWRRRVIARRGHALMDKIVLEFERAADATVLRRWLTARGW